MKLYYDKKSNDPTYYIQQGIRNGKKTTTRNVKRIGKHSELLALSSDPLAYAKDQVALYNKDYKEGRIELSLKVDFNEKLNGTANVASHSTAVNVGYFMLQKIYQDLRIGDFLKTVQDESKATYNFNLVNRFLTYGRILDPRSKLGTFDRLDTFYEQPSFEYHHILRFLDVLASKYDEYLEHLFHGSENVINRNTSVCYFDCTNYYFECEEEDGDDYVDEVTGEVLKGLRKYGPGKDHKPNPIVQMGLFMDGDGIPISMCINSGSDNEQKSAIPLEKKIISMFKNKEFIYCADAGLGSFDIRKFNSMGGRAFIVTQSIKKLSQVLQEAVFNDFDYKRLSDDAPATIKHMKNFDHKDPDNLNLYNDKIYKVIVADKAVDLGLTEEHVCKNGNVRNVKSKATIHQKLIITFSRKMMEYQRRVRNAQIERAKKLLGSKKADEVGKGPNDVKRLIKRISDDTRGKKAKDVFELNLALIEEEEKYDGFYAIATNLDDNAKDILAINHNRYKIEDCFRVLKTNFDARPTYLSNRDRIVAHFLVCYTALLIYRLLEKKLDNYGEHFTTENILETLRNMNVVKVQEDLYQAAYSNSSVCTNLNALFNLELDRKNYLPKVLNKKIKSLLR